MGLWRLDRPQDSLAMCAPEHKEVGQTPGAPVTVSHESPQIAERQKTPFEKLGHAGDEAWRARGDIEEAIRLYAQALAWQHRRRRWFE